MRVLFFVNSLGGGGAERVITNLANYWAQQGWRVTIATLSEKDVDSYSLHAHVQRFSIGLDRSSQGWLDAITCNVRRIFRLRRILRGNRPHAAIAFMAASNVTLALAGAALGGVKLIGSERIYPPAMPLGRMWEALRSFAYRNLDFVVAQNERSAKWLRTHTRARKVVTIPNMVIWPLPNTQPEVAPPEPRGRQLLLAVGRLHQQKGFDILLQVFHRLAHSLENWDLAILGEGPARAELSAMVGNLRLAERVYMPGRVGNLGDWYSRCDVFVMSSRFEGFPNALLEAMAYGACVVSFDCPTGPAELIAHQSNGLLVPAGDIVGLEAALRSLIQSAELRTQLSSRAADVRGQYEIRTVANAWENLISPSAELRS